MLGFPDHSLIVSLAYTAYKKYTARAPNAKPWMGTSYVPAYSVELALVRIAVQVREQKMYPVCNQGT